MFIYYLVWRKNTLYLKTTLEHFLKNPPKGLLHLILYLGIKDSKHHIDKAQERILSER